MPQTLTTKARDGDVYAVTVTFTDVDNSTAVTPTTLSWTLRNGSGVVVNSRDSVAIGTPTSSETITLSGNDLLYSDGAERYLVVDGTWNSAVLGVNGLPLRDHVKFEIEDVKDG